MNHNTFWSKSLAALLALSLTLTLTACGNKPASEPMLVPVVSQEVGTIAQEFLPPEAPVAEPVELHTVVGTVVDATMNQLMLLLDDGRELSFPTVDADMQMPNGLLEGMMVAVTYRGAEITGGDTTGVHVDTIVDTTPEVKAAVQTVTDNMAPVDEIVYTTTRVHVRAENNVDAQILKTANKGEEFRRTGKGPYGWSRVEYNGGAAYIFGDYLATEKPAAPAIASAMNGTIVATNDTVYTTVRLRMHETAELDAKVLGVAPVGLALTRVGTFAQGWSEVIYDGKTAFCDTEYLTTAAPAAPANNDTPPAGEVNRQSAGNATYKTTVALRLHVTYSTDSTVVTVAPKGTPLTVLNWMDNHWAEVSYNGQTVYCVTQYLAP